MSCESYKSALSEAAAGAPATSALRSHLIVCPECRSALAAEEALFASIDAGLRSAVNVEVPASLIPSVRARLDEPAPRKRSLVRFLVPAAAGLVVAVFAAHNLRQPPANPSKSTSSNATASAPQPAPSGSFPSQEGPSAATQPGRSQRTALAWRTPHRLVVVQMRPETHDRPEVPEVLVPRDQQLLLASYAEQWRTHRYLRVTAELIPKPPLEPLEIAPIQIDVVDVKLLTDAGSR